MKSLGEDILSLVRIPSVTGNEKPLADWLVARLEGGPAARGSRLLRLEDSLILAPEEPAAGRPMVILAGHIDTVPRGDAPEPAERGGRVFGRGACDMKAGVAVMLALAERLPAADGFAARAYVFYTGEEGPASGNALGAILRREDWLRRAGLAILLEPTNGDLELGCNGSIHLAVTFHGRSCHSARPWKGSHPLLGALPWLERILRHTIRPVEVGGVVFREVVSLTTVRAGEVRNVIPGTLQVNLNLRYPPDRSPEEAERFALSLCPEGAVRREPPGGEAADGERPEVEVAIVDHSPPGRIDFEAPLYRHLCESTGLERRGKQGWTDVARFTSLGIPALNWGPGDPELAHTQSELVDIEEAERCLKRLESFFRGEGPADGKPGGMP